MFRGFLSKTKRTEAPEATIQRLRSELASRDERIAQLEGELVTARTDANASAQAEIVKLNKQLQDARNEAHEILAAQGMSIHDLPEQCAESLGADRNRTIDSLRRKLENTTDPQEKYRLSAEIRGLAERSKQ